MNFYHHNQAITPPKDAIFPCLVLSKNDWDDYTYKTTFITHYYSAPRKSVKLGTLKILQRGERETTIPEAFERLDSSYCSLGQTLEYYQKLIDLGQKAYKAILKGLNDIVFAPSLSAAFKSEFGFKKSLIRFSEAEKAYKEGRALFTRLVGKTEDDRFSFKFLCQVPGADAPHEIQFDFTPDQTDLHRIIALIGKNGTGKTQVLARFASAMSGWNKDAGEFIPERPNFSKVIAISYSIFDRFDRPEEGTETYSYVYCGIRRGNRNLPGTHNGDQGDEIYSQEEIEEKLLTALQQVEEGGRSSQWGRILSELLEEKITIKKLRNREGKLIYSVYNRFSSGQSILVRLMSEVIASIAEESIVLFDEPEIHLHPDALSALIRAFHLLLKEFDSYAIVATHSPIILQQIPSRRVRVFKREGGYPLVTPLGIECFGENLTVITNEVFETSDLYSNYQDYLRDLANSHTYDQIMGFFDGRLGLNAKAFLRSLYTPEMIRDGRKG